nr:AAA family ATPase [Paraburkholderia domus]
MTRSSVEHVDARQLYENAIPRMISQLLVEKKGRRVENEKYSRAVKRLEHLVQSQVEVSDIGGKEDMHVNGVQYKKASSGTQITLSFFGLTRLGEPNCIILWDEPENGLHPTRRARLLELMFEDGRQFILATHAAEFAPVFSEKGKVFRCEANFDADNTVVRLGVQRVADRRDAFIALEALGVHPARALFTANVVIWVEGPTELVFYRHWLVPRLTRRGLHEGFHYTFMQYGGALVSYLTIADDSQFESTFDLLSMCRHPILIVDSDLREAPVNKTPVEFLKKGAARLLAEVEKLNSDRRDAALFAWTAGREVENYLPEAAVWYAVGAVWQGYKDHEIALTSGGFFIGQYQSYEEALEKHFDAANVVNVDKDDPMKRAAKGRSLWGAGNKVEMMRAALAMPNLAEGKLKWGCSSLLQQVEDFVVRISEK